VFEVIFHFFEVIILVQKKKMKVVFHLLGHFSCWVKIRLHTENQLSMLSGNALTIYVGLVGGVVWWVVVQLITLYTTTQVELG
jgi:hypothetical protein